ncbi:outer membrane protein [Desulfocapsa sulfexigens DSM 10523]|uniref:Outer membrane protein n=1 Tax=Desulfocapsa sulfexigens (strain DSM 10523 / SB164P1) TaxID=1167006 RepID=M1PCA2_DESSD|nr:TolC family protein [Desulfocapsa sulfexigens]AGF79252.1 outer membrane protein [Desulfocapsa sulfexigens DSM 10523]
MNYKLQSFFNIVAFLTLLTVHIPSSGYAAVEPVRLTLETAVARALRYNRNLISDTLDLDNSRLNMEAAQNTFDIKVNPLSSINYTSNPEEEQSIWRVGGLISKKFTSGVILNLEPSIEKETDEYGAGVGFSLAIPLIRGLGKDINLDSVYASEYALASSDRTLHQKKVNTILNTVTTVYTLIREQHLVSLYTEQLKHLKVHLKSAIVKEKSGIAKSMDIYRAEIRIKDIQESLSLARERVAEIADRLKDIVALPLDSPIYVEAPQEYTLITMKREQAVKIALKQRIESFQSKADIAEAMRREKIARHNTLPELKLVSTYTRRGRSSDFGDVLFFDEDRWSIGLTSSTDLARSEEKTAWAKSRLAVKRENLKFESSQQNIIREVRTVLNSLEKSEERIALRREQLIQATGKQRLAHIKFQYNEADNFDLIESQTQVERARVNLMSDEINYIINGYRLRAVMGTLLAYSPETKP